MASWRDRASVQTQRRVAVLTGLWGLFLILFFSIQSFSATPVRWSGMFLVATGLLFLGASLFNLRSLSESRVRK